MNEPNVNSLQVAVIARVNDFFSDRTLWQRRLWAVGPFLALQELREAAQMEPKKVLAPAAIKFLGEEILDLVSKDKAFIPPFQRQYVVNCLKNPLVAESLEWRTLRALELELRPTYLIRIASLLEERTERLGAERVARSIASHLLDSGYSQNYLRIWWKKHVYRGDGSKLPGALRMACEELIHAAGVTHTVLIPMAQAPRWPEQNGWVPADKVRTWITNHCGQVGTLGRQHGAIVIEVHARDQWAAVRDAIHQLDSVVARVSVGDPKNSLVPSDNAWVKGFSKPIKMTFARGVGVFALQREGKLLVKGNPTGNEGLVDTALHLLGPLQSGPASSAVASGWAAIEATLNLPGEKEKVRAADHLAALVTCSWTRAELTTLARRYAKTHEDHLAEEINNCTANKEAANALLVHLRSGLPLTMLHASDNAALLRLRDIVSTPHAKLLDVETHVSRAIRRLYRQRNLVLHGGKIDAVALESALRVAAPLVGAGFDRIVHAALVEGVSPGDITARAHLRLRSLKEQGVQVDLVGMLD